MRAMITIMVTTVAAMMSTITTEPAIMATVLSEPELAGAAAVGGEVVIDTPGPTGTAKTITDCTEVLLLVCYLNYLISQL